jgi:L-2-hydroxyglutarate oxidase LhgO
VQLALRTLVDRAESTPTGFIVSALCGSTAASREIYRFRTRWLINSAGLQAPALAARIEGLSSGLIPAQYLCKGSYFSLNGPSPFTHLIYPLPDLHQHGLGVHATLDIAGQVRFGPDTEYTEELDYAVDPQRHTAFCEAIRRYYPALDPARLVPAYAGIRPKLQAPGAASEDFHLQDWHQHGLAGLVQLFGIESPGLTASLALAREVADRLDTL